MNKLKLPRNPKILIVDDEPDTLEIFSRHLAEDYHVETVESAYLALEKLKNQSFHIALTDLVMPGEDGLELLKKIKQKWPQTSVVVISGKASIEMAVQAMKLGAEEFIEKPVEDLEIIKLKIQNILRSKWQTEEIERLRSILDSEFDRCHIVGNSLPIQQIMEKIKKIAPLDTTVLITGETGVGKELFAELIYKNSNRKHEKFVVVNCGSIPETLLESMLFGHTRGAFTGAVKEKEGYFKEADGGTLFLDEITETSTAFQIKLLRALEKGTIRKVGGESDDFVDVRIIAASNLDILKEVQKGNFREDLYYRLNVIGINIPPLRERMEDIKLLANEFVQDFGKKYKKKELKISDQVMNLLLTRDWNGNVRELKNVIEHAVALCMHDTLILEDLPSHIFQTDDRKFYKRKYDNLTFAKAKESFEKQYVERMLKMFDGDVTKVANFSKIKRPNLYDKFKKYDIDPNDFRNRN
ncbi:MAG: sigma-54 dependent transcriptional regulator [Candidatus Cloacimonetes bacterium]|nr:sigma-54 dependent transcriptional regulator [Candidatus Cloacimonadota bacterium]MCF7869366.1 sigma-54 dependent transcriptional regulator [Candidatus Cloacimonadota bacterium]